MSDSENMHTSSAPLVTDDDVLSFTQQKRKELVDAIVEKGMPSDNDDRKVLLTAMSDMDRTALSNKKIGSKEKQGQADRMAAILIAKLSDRFGSQSPFERTDTQRALPPTFDDAGLPPLQLVDGETAVGVANRGYDDFMAEVEGKQANQTKA